MTSKTDQRQWACSCGAEGPVLLSVRFCTECGTRLFVDTNGRAITHNTFERRGIYLQKAHDVLAQRVCLIEGAPKLVPVLAEDLLELIEDLNFAEQALHLALRATLSTKKSEG